jgi:hypothetical protein
MVTDGGWSWFLPILFSAPWIAGIVWVLLRSPRGGGETPPSMAELARRRLWTQ